MAGPSNVWRSQDAINFNLSTFGLHMDTGTSNAASSSRMGTIVEKIRRDVRQLGLLCAATDKEKLINVLIINQQLDIIYRPEVHQFESVEEPRTIKSILQPPTMPQRVKPKLNMNLKVSYGVVTAKDVVQHILDREATDREHEIVRKQDEIAKHGRENWIGTVVDELKRVRKPLGGSLRKRCDK